MKKEIPKYQVVIASVPWTDTDSPLMAPAVLKSSLAKNKITSVCIDLNAEIKAWINSHTHKDSIIQFMLNEEISAESRPFITELIDRMADRLLEFKSQWICLSLLTYLSQITNKWLCARLKQKQPNARIVIGGPGTFVTLGSQEEYAKTLIKEKLIDFFIKGDGENSLPALIKEQTKFAGINTNSWKQLEDLDSLPYADFDDYDWKLYNEKSVSIVGSKGCVRKCKFCDIHEHWKKFQWRSGEKIFKEMLHQSKRYGIKYFKFADSLVNGNQKEFRKLISLLAQYNSAADNQKKIYWTGQCIIRPKNQMQEEDWKLTADSGALLLSVGVESFVEDIRYHIGKNFSNSDLNYALEMAKKYKIKLILLTIVGYVTETSELFQQQINWIEKNKHFANDPIHSIQIGSGLAILPGTWLDRNKNNLGIEMGDTQVFQDWTIKSINSTPGVRMSWHKQMKACLEHNGFTAVYNMDNHMLIESYLNEKYSRS